MRALNAFIKLHRTMPSPRVTVIIATYNWSTVLPYAINSVLDQTMTDFELLVVGDGCTDDSEQVVTAIKDPRVRWINLANEHRPSIGSEQPRIAGSQRRVHSIFGSR